MGSRGGQELLVTQQNWNLIHAVIRDMVGMPKNGPKPVYAAEKWPDYHKEEAPDGFFLQDGKIFWCLNWSNLCTNFFKNLVSTAARKCAEDDQLALLKSKPTNDELKGRVIDYLNSVSQLELTPASMFDATLDEFKQKLNSKFECSDSGPAGYFLGVNIYRDRAQKKLYLSQEHYMESLLERFDMTGCNPAKTPLPSGFRPIPATDQEHEQAQHQPFPKLVGSILYAATVTRPDLAHAASVLSRFISKWNESHWLAAKHCLSELHWGMLMQIGEEILTQGGQPLVMSSRVYGGVVAWKSKRQSTVALSTTEAEYMASADAAKQAIWLRLLLEDIGLGLGDQPFQLVNDNAGAIALSKNPKIEDKTVSLAHAPSVENIADLLTKSLPAEAFVKLCQLLGMKRLDQGGVLE
ncbi:hypothetical protein D1P53_003813 [Cryptococcus gattii VGV]|nr:hypothetical protein D1P53_003813 [Cryptococcus gattii VGV]